MGKTFRKIREESREPRSKTATREEKAIDKYKKYIYNSVSSEDDDLDDDFDDINHYETNHTKSIHRK